MKQYIITAYLFIASVTAFAQSADTDKINSLKSVLNTLKGTARIDCLNAICEQYFNMGFFGENEKRVDSIETYAAKANTEAEKLNYIKGTANAQLYIAFTEILRRKFTTAEDRLQKILLIKNLDENIYGHANAFLSSIYSEKYSNTDKATVYKKKALYHFRRMNNLKDEGIALTHLCMMYTGKGDYESGVEYCTNAVTVAKKLSAEVKNDAWVDYQVLQSLSSIIKLYQLAGDHAAAKDYMQQVKQYHLSRNFKRDDDYQWATAYYMEGKYDSAIYYYSRHLKNNPGLTGAKMDVGKSYLNLKNYQRALQFLQESVDLFRSRAGDRTRPNARRNLMYSLLYLAQAYYETNNFREAHKHAKEGLEILKEVKGLLPIDQYELFYKSYHYTGQADSALLYLQKYNSEKEFVLSKQFLFKLNNYKNKTEDERKAGQIALLSKDNLIKEQQLQQQALLKEQREAQITLLDKDNRIKDQQLRQEHFLKEQKESKIALLNKDNTLLGKDKQLNQQLLAQQAFQKKILIAGLLIFLLIGFFIFRNLALKRKNENLQRQRLENELKVQQLKSQKKQAELHRQTTDLEMQALRAQMNPHFIFNCLSSINWFIIENNTEAASDYLTRFSRLIRMVLVNSQKAFISLQDELNMLQLYLDMERLRFDNSFDYNISVSEELSSESIYVPPLILQPFCENAIRHGLMDKEGEKVLAININSQDYFLNCVITDNGIGRKKAAEIKNRSVKKEVSLGLKITNERLALLNGENKDKAFYEIEDVVNERGDVTGTRVILKIRYRETVEAYEPENVSQII